MLRKCLAFGDRFSGEISSPLKNQAYDCSPPSRGIAFASAKVSSHALTISMTLQAGEMAIWYGLLKTHALNCRMLRFRVSRYHHDWHGRWMAQQWARHDLKGSQLNG